MVFPNITCKNTIVREFSNIHLSKTGFNWNRSPTLMMLTPSNGLLVPMICCNLKFKKLNMPLSTTEISSIKTTFSLFNCVRMVFSLSQSNVQYSKPLLAGISFDIECCFTSRSCFQNFRIIWIFACKGIEISEQPFI